MSLSGDLDQDGDREWTTVLETFAPPMASRQHAVGHGGRSPLGLWPLAPYISNLAAVRSH